MVTRRQFLERLMGAGAIVVAGPRILPARLPDFAPLSDLRRLPACRLDIYTGFAPNVNDPPTGSLLASLRLVPRLAEARRVELEAVSPVVATANGLPGHFRLSCMRQTVYQGEAGIRWGELRFSGPIVAGGTVTIDQFHMRRL